ncbi:hypothetical protein O6H91_15G059900 [Diphasiastrum complanatum]|nr:hypothetical protein O6H91_15G059900 [Diphasiastrum complanatum]
MKEMKSKMKHLDLKKALGIPSGKAITTSTLSNVVYVGRIPHGFYEEQMREYFGQFGVIQNLRLSRNKKTGKSKHYAFIEFASAEVAAIVAESMNNYLLFESLLQVKLVPQEKIHPTLWIGANRKFQVKPWKLWEKERHNRDRTAAEQKSLLKRLIRRDDKRKRNLLKAGIDYDYPDLRSSLPGTSKKIKFTQEGS